MLESNTNSPDTSSATADGRSSTSVSGHDAPRGLTRRQFLGASAGAGGGLVLSFVLPGTLSSIAAIASGDARRRSTRGSRSAPTRASR